MTCARACGLLKKNMPGYRVRKAPFRAVLLEKFPYVVWYAIEGSDVVVYRVRHGRQRPLRKIKDP